MNNANAKTAMRFILLMGAVSLFADMTYEGARSISGAYLAVLGASGAIVGLTAGAGELLGYGLRLFSGLISDKTQRYWTITLVGYAVNLLAVPLLALTGHWAPAAGLMIAERIGKAIRTPARDVMLSYAAGSVGRGWGFAVHEAMDQIGAMTGPMIVMAALALSGAYRYAFAVLAIPAALAMAVLIAARFIVPHPQKLETAASTDRHTAFGRVFWLYLAAIGLTAAGFADYPLMAFHIKAHALLTDAWIPLLYAMAMGIDALAALLFGRLYDKKGLTALIIAFGVSSLCAVLAFSLRPWAIIIGVALWGVGMGAQESIVRSFVADTVPAARRGTGFGVFNAWFGVAWFVGSALLGVLYDWSVPALIAVSVGCQWASVAMLIAIQNRTKR